MARKLPRLVTINTALSLIFDLWKRQNGPKIETMFLNFIGINEKILNLNSVALIEDKSEDGRSAALVTTTDGLEIEFTDDDADILFQRAELIMQATDEVLAKLQGAASNT